MGLRVKPDDEDEGLDLSQHNEEDISCSGGRGRWDRRKSQGRYVDCAGKNPAQFLNAEYIGIRCSIRAG